MVNFIVMDGAYNVLSEGRSASPDPYFCCNSLKNISYIRNIIAYIYIFEGKHITLWHFSHSWYLAKVIISNE